MRLKEKVLTDETLELMIDGSLYENAVSGAYGDKLNGLDRIIGYVLNHKEKESFYFVPFEYTEGINIVDHFVGFKAEKGELIEVEGLSIEADGTCHAYAESPLGDLVLFNVGTFTESSYEFNGLFVGLDDEDSPYTMGLNREYRDLILDNIVE